MRDISFDTRTTPFSATIVENTRWRRASPMLFSLLDVRTSVGRPQDFVIIFYFSPLKFFYMRVCGLRSTQITTFRTNNRDPQRNTPKKSLFMFFLLFLISRHLALTPHFNVRLISAYPRVSLASAPTYPANSERMLCPSDYEVATTI